MKTETRIRIAAAGLFAMALLGLVNLGSDDPNLRFYAPLIALMFLAVGVISLEYPVPTTAFGCLIWSASFLGWVWQEVGNGTFFNHLFANALVFLVFASVFALMLQGFLAGMRRWSAKR